MRRFAALIAVLATAGVVAAPACAQGFTDYRQAAADQYTAPSGNNPGNSGNNGNNPGNNGNNPGNNGGKPGNQQFVAGSGNQTATPGKRKATTPKRRHGASGKSGAGGRRTNSGVLGARNTLPVAVSGPSHHVPSARGQLPFTGGPLGVVVLVALLMLAAGFLLAAASRVRRVRRDGAATH